MSVHGRTGTNETASAQPCVGASGDDRRGGPGPGGDRLPYVANPGGIPEGGRAALAHGNRDRRPGNAIKTNGYCWRTLYGSVPTPKVGVSGSEGTPALAY